MATPLAVEPLADTADAALHEKVLAAVHQVLGPPGPGLALHEPEFAGREWEYVKECLDTGWVSSVGAFVDRFERDLKHRFRRS